MNYSYDAILSHEANDCSYYGYISRVFMPGKYIFRIEIPQVVAQSHFFELYEVE